jgi:hypothetical protein
MCVQAAFARSRVQVYGRPRVRLVAPLRSCSVCVVIIYVCAPHTRTARVQCALWLGEAPPTPPSHAAAARRASTDGGASPAASAGASAYRGSARRVSRVASACEVLCDSSVTVSHTPARGIWRASAGASATSVTAARVSIPSDTSTSSSAPIAGAAPAPRSGFCAPGSQLHMLKDRDMLLLTIGFGIGAAMFNAVIALMGAMLRQRGCVHVVFCSVIRCGIL